jgi:NADH-quinone oxidoreductase subunit L
VAVGVTLAWVLIGRREVPREAPQEVSFVTRAARADIYGDAINDGLVVEPGRRLVGGLLAFDRQGADGLFVGSSAAVGAVGTLLRRAQNGFVRSYALSVLGGVLLVVLALLAVNLG